MSTEFKRLRSIWSLLRLFKRGSVDNVWERSRKPPGRIGKRYLRASRTAWLHFWTLKRSRPRKKWSMGRRISQLPPAIKPIAAITPTNNLVSDWKCRMKLARSSGKNAVSSFGFHTWLIFFFNSRWVISTTRACSSSFAGWSSSTPTLK